MPVAIEGAARPEYIYGSRQIYTPAPIERAVPFIIFLLSAAYLCIFLRYSSLEPDEGIVLQGAERLLHGELPYRDFFSFYTPGSFYLVAGLFRIFGDHFIVARASLAVVGAVSSTVTYLLARRVCPRPIAIFAAVLATTAGATFRFLVLHNPYSTVFCSLSIYAVLRFIETQKLSWGFSAGSLASLVFLTEQSKGAGLYAGLALGLIALRVIGQTPLPNRRGFVVLTAGALWPLGLTFVYFAAHNALGVMIQHWIWPLQHYNQANRVPYGFQNWSDQSREAIFYTGPIWLRIIKALAVSPSLLIPVLPLIALSMLCYRLLKVSRQTGISANDIYYILICSSLTGLLLSVVAVRADNLHFIYLAPLWYVVLAWILGSNDFRSPGLLATRPFLIAYSAAAFGLVALALLFSTTGAHNHVHSRRGSITTGAKDTAIEYIEAHLAPGGRLLIYPYLPLYNYLSATRSPAQLDYFQPGMNTREQAQDIIASLEVQPATPVLFEPWFPAKISNSWPETPLPAIASDQVADFIVRNYRTCKMLDSPEGWRFHYMVHKTKTCPAITQASR
jgi:hypothetical protein